jgi:hypothetical protein
MVGGALSTRSSFYIRKTDVRLLLPRPALLLLKSPLRSLRTFRQAHNDGVTVIGRLNCVCLALLVEPFSPNWTDFSQGWRTSDGLYTPKPAQ